MTTLSRILLAGLLFAATQPARAADECDAKTSQADMTDCYGAAYKKSDATLNALYRQIAGRLKDDAATAKLLVGTQRAWVRFRDAECDFASAGAAGGTARPMIAAICLDRLTEARIKDFQDYLKCQEGDMSCPVPAN